MNNISFGNYILTPANCNQQSPTKMFVAKQTIQKPFFTACQSLIILSGLKKQQLMIPHKGSCSSSR